MYRIKGADQKEYGPVAADQVRQWIVEHRLNGASLVQAEGTTEWKPLAAYAEFADALGGPAPIQPATTPGTLAPLPPGGGAVPKTNSMALAGFIMGLATVLLGWCCCYGFPFNLLGIIFSSMGLSQINKNPEFERGKGLAIAGLVLSIAGTLLTILLYFLLGAAVSLQDILRRIQQG